MTLERHPSESSSGASRPPIVVLTQPGWTELTLTEVSRRAYARCVVSEFSAAFEALYANGLVFHAAEDESECKRG
jgi:hypothetical protein